VTAQHIAPVIPASAVPAARGQARSAARRTLPLARPVRSVPQDVVYGLARIDASGRICERAIITDHGVPWMPVAVIGFFGLLLALRRIPVVARALAAPGMASRLELPHSFRAAEGRPS
jgi:hypothetical protein